MSQLTDSAAMFRDGHRIVLALIALGVGFSVYLLGRSAQVYAALPFQVLDLPRVSFGLLAGSLPSFCHMFAFSLATAVLLRPWPKASRASVFVWVLLETAFEVDQLNSPRSTFDPFDLLAIYLGGLATWQGIKHGW